MPLPLDTEPKPTSLGPILQAIEDRLVKVTGLARTAILFISRDIQEVPKFRAQRDVVVRVGSFESPEEWVIGNERIATKLDRRLLVYARQKRVLDRADSDKIWLIDAKNGYLAFEEMVVNALHGFQPFDGNSNKLTTCPLHLASGEAPEREYRAVSGWGDATVELLCSYVLPMTNDQFGAPA